MNFFRPHWLQLFLLLSTLLAGCGRRPGEQLYDDALSHWQEGQLVRARALLEKSIRRRTGSIENADASNRLGLLLWEMQKPQDAVHAFQDSLRIAADQPAVLCNLGVAQCRAQLFKDAEKTFKTVLQQIPKDSRAAAYAGAICAKNQNWSDATQLLGQALRQTPDNPRLQTAMALCELHTKDAKTALIRLNAVAQNHPDYAPALFNMASISRHQLNQPAEAKREFERYLKLADPDSPMAAAAREQIQAIEQGVAVQTIVYTPTQKRDRTASQSHFAHAVALQRDGKTVDAIAEYIRSIEADDRFERAFYNLGIAYYSTEQMAQARDAFSRAVQLKPTYVEARYNLALVLHYHLNQSDRAQQELETVLSQKPDYQPAADLLQTLRP